MKTPRIVLDTNAYISGLLWYTDSSRIIECALDEKISVYISRRIIAEILKVLSRDFGFDDAVIAEILEYVAEFTVLCFPSAKLDIVKEDSSDNAILECAHECGADLIITQDKHLLKLKEFGKCKIIHPADFRFFPE